VTGGALRVNNISGTSATGTNTVTVNSTGTLGGAGFISGAVTVNPGGIVAPGNSLGTLTVGSLTLGSGSILNYEFNATPANDFTQVTALNGLTINGGGFNLYQENTLNAFNTINTYNLIGYSGTIGGTGVSALSVLNPQPGRAYTFAATGSLVTLGIASSGIISDWSADAGGSWGTPGSWTGAIPDAIGATANFNFPLTASRTATLDGTRTAGGISLDSAAPALGYTIATGTGGTLSINNGLSQANIIVASGTHAITADASLDSSNTVAAVAAASSLTISGSIGGTGALVKSGGGLLDLTNIANPYVGNTSVLGGTLGFSALGSLGGGTSLTLDGATLRYNTGNTADISTKTVTIGASGAIIDTGGADLTYANAIGNGGLGNLTVNGGGTLTMQGNNSFTGTTTLNSGSLVLTGTSASTGGTFVNGANSLIAITSDAALGAVPGAATANLTLNPGAGNTARLRADGGFSLNANRNISLASGTGAIDTNGNNITIAGSLTGSGLLRKTGAGTLTLSGAATATGGATLDAGTVSVSTAANLPSGPLTMNGTAAIIATAATSSTFSPQVNGTNSITGTASVVQNLGILTGGGNLTFGGPFVNDYTGNFTAFTGTLTASGGGSRWNGSSGGGNLTLDLGVTGTAVRSTATLITIGALAGTSTANLGGSGGGATQAVTYQIGSKTVGGLGVTPVNSVYDGLISNGTGLTSLNKVGLSSLTLNGNSAYTGTTTVTAGRLAVNGDLSAATGSISVLSGATLGGSGKLGGALSVQDGGIFAPGNSAGTLTTSSSAVFSNASLLEFELNGTDQTAGAGINDFFTGITTLTLDGVLNVTATAPFTGLSSGTWRLLSYTGALTDNTLTLGTMPATDAGTNFVIDTATPGQVNLVLVPEPGAGLLGLLATLGLLRRRRVLP
jgi:fibronectin-binding autotransporter adhesin